VKARRSLDRTGLPDHKDRGLDSDGLARDYAKSTDHQMCFLGLSPLWPTLFGGFLATAGGIAATWWAKTLEYYAMQRQIASALAGEIKGIMQVVQKRKFVEQLEYFITQSEESGVLYYKIFPVSDSFIAVYEGNIEKLGMLPHPISADVAFLYASVKSVWEDLKTLQREPLHEWPLGDGLKFLKELAALTKQTKNIGYQTAQSLDRIAQRNIWQCLFQPYRAPMVKADDSIDSPTSKTQLPF
jgi:hypothetical protein